MSSYVTWIELKPHIPGNRAEAGNDWVGLAPTGMTPS